jgi:GNAT superfamily N-acetyltransferase
MAEDSLLAELAAALPDQPRWVAARGLLLARRCEVLLGPEGKSSSGYLLVERGGALACAVHRPVAALVARLRSGEHGPRQLLAPLVNAEPLRPLLPGWREYAATVHVHPAPETLPRPVGPARFLTLAEVERLHDLAPALASELTRALGRGPVAAAFHGDRPVSFAYATFETERWFDLSLDTLEGFRRQGLATRAAAFLIHHQQGRGKSPVWGALEADAVSMAMAKRYGFRAVDRLMVFEPPDAAPGATRGRPPRDR